jgi:hypothetical protein
MYNPSLEILEVNYSVSPGGVDEFEVYSTDAQLEHLQNGKKGN